MSRTLRVIPHWLKTTTPAEALAFGLPFKASLGLDGASGPAAWPSNHHPKCQDKQEMLTSPHGKKWAKAKSSRLRRRQHKLHCRHEIRAELEAKWQQEQELEQDLRWSLGDPNPYAYEPSEDFDDWQEPDHEFYLDDAFDDYNKGKSHGYNQGFNAGYDEGYDAGWAAAYRHFSN